MTGGGRRAPGRKPRGPARTQRIARRSPSARYAIAVRDQQAALSIPAARIRRMARVALAAEGVAAATISVALVDNQAIHRLNRRHLNHDYETDVLSFLFESEPCDTPAIPSKDTSSKDAASRGTAATPSKDSPRGAGRRIDGEVVISAEMAVRSAPRFGWSAAEELGLYLVHGLLHLCGYDDQTESERRLMRKRERALLKLLED